MSDHYLKTCPFCGSKARIDHFRAAREPGARFRVACTNRECGIDNTWNHYTLKDAIEKMEQEG